MSMGQHRSGIGRPLGMVGWPAENMLVQRASARHVDHLDTAADAEHGQLRGPRGQHERCLPAVGCPIWFDAAAVAAAAVKRGIDVGSSGDDQPVHVTQCGVGPIGLIGGQQHCHPARRPHHVGVLGAEGV